MKTQTHLINLEKKVLNFMLENKLSQDYEKAILEVERLKDIKHNKPTRITLILVIKQLESRLKFFQLNDTINLINN